MLVGVDEGVLERVRELDRVAVMGGVILLLGVDTALAVAVGGSREVELGVDVGVVVLLRVPVRVPVLSAVGDAVCVPVGPTGVTEGEGVMTGVVLAVRLLVSVDVLVPLDAGVEEALAEV